MQEPQSLVKIMAILTAIPVVMFALWGEYFSRYIEALEKDEPRFDRDVEVGRLRSSGMVVLLGQAALYLINFPGREAHPVYALSFFLGALFVQSQMQLRLERRVRKSAPQTAAESAKSVQKAVVGARAFVWAAVSILNYLSCFYVGVMAFLLAGRVFGAGATTMSVLALCGCLGGILLGMAFNFALGPFYVRKTLPCRPLEDAELQARIQALFARAGVPAPGVWVIDVDSIQAHNAMVSGFTRGRGWFRPGLFITQSLLTSCTPAELEAVVLHEISHLALAHLRARMFRVIGLILAATAVTMVFLGSIWFVAPALLPVARVVAIAFPILMVMATNRKFAEGQELEADAHAVLALGADLDAMIFALRKLDSMNAAPGGRRVLGTHPETEARIEELRMRVEFRRALEAERAHDAAKAAAAKSREDSGRAA